MFKPKTVASIVSAFTKTIAELETVIDTNKAVQERNGDVIQALIQENGKRQQEIDDAAAISTKLKSIFQ